MHLPWDGWEACLNHYRLGPLLYASELPLPELESVPAELVPSPVASGTRSPVVTVRLGRAPEKLAAPLAATPGWEASATEYLFRVPEVATYYAHDGEEVIVEPAENAPDVDLRSYLLGTLFAAICHQRGLLPLHASAIGTPSGAVAFLGPSGAGKSSLVSFLAQRSYAVVADDICLIDPAAPLERRVLPVAPWLKLWRTTLDALGDSSEGLPRTFLDEDKYRVRMAAEHTPLPLAQVILLERLDWTSHDYGVVGFERLAPAHAIRAVLELTYQSWLIQVTGQTERYFLRCGQALQGVRVYRMRRPWGFDQMAATLNALEAHLLRAGDSGSQSG